MADRFGPRGSGQQIQTRLQEALGRMNQSPGGWLSQGFGELVPQAPAVPPGSPLPLRGTQFPVPQDQGVGMTFPTGDTRFGQEAKWARGNAAAAQAMQKIQARPVSEINPNLTTDGMIGACRTILMSLISGFGLGPIPLAILEPRKRWGVCTHSSRTQAAWVSSSRIPTD